MKMTDLQDWEVALIKAMKDDGRFNNQAIQSTFSTIDRNFCASRLSANDWLLLSLRPVPAASQAALEQFLESIRRFGRDAAMTLYQGGGPVVQVDYHFMPVGQGLFTAGQLRLAGAQPFTWVYDCGTLSAAVDMAQAIANCPVVPPTINGGKGEIDILTISHFHEDHISGMVALLNCCRIRVLLLPYLTPQERMLRLVQSGANAGSDYSEFLRNPVSFVAARGEVGQILLVQRGDEPPPESERGDPARLRDDWKLVIPAPEQPSAHHKLPDPQLHGPANLLPVAAVLTLSGIWEFVPYCDEKLENRFDLPFLTTVGALADAFIASGLQSDLDALRQHYHAKTVTKGGNLSHETENRISLHLYAGPVGPIRASDLFVSGPAAQATGGPFRLSGPDQSRIGQLLTGDASFKPQAFKRLLKKFTDPGRLQRGAVFQVPHHGSARNWHVGAAAVCSQDWQCFPPMTAGFAQVVLQQGIRIRWFGKTCRLLFRFGSI